MSLTQEELTLVVKAAVQQALAAQAASGGGGGDRGGDQGGCGRVCEKNYRRMDKFDGGEESWKAWEFDLKVATRASSSEVGECMVVAETATVNVTGADFERDHPVRFKGMAKRGRELFEVLCMHTTGDAKAVIKEVPGGDGLAAWQLLTKCYARRTLARTLRRYREAMNPKKVSEASEILGAVAKWENGVKELERVEDVKLGDMIKLAALTEICTDDIRDTIFQNVDAGGSYESIKEKVISWVSNRAASRSEATPMDVGAVGGRGGEQHDESTTSRG